MGVTSYTNLFLSLLSATPFVHGQFASTDASTYGDDSPTPFQTFMSNTDVKPPELLVTKYVDSVPNSGYMFVGVDGKPSSTQNVPCIFGKALNLDAENQLLMERLVQICPRIN